MFLKCHFLILATLFLSLQLSVGEIYSAAPPPQQLISQESQNSTPSSTPQNDNSLLLTILLFVAGLGGMSFLIGIYFYYSSPKKDNKYSTIKESSNISISANNSNQDLDIEENINKDRTSELVSAALDIPISNKSQKSIVKYHWDDGKLKISRVNTNYYNLNWEPSSVYRHEQSRNELILLHAVLSGDHAFAASVTEKDPFLYYLHPRIRLCVNNPYSLYIVGLFFNIDERSPLNSPIYYCDSWEPAVVEFREDNLFYPYQKGKLLLKTKEDSTRLDRSFTKETNEREHTSAVSDAQPKLQKEKSIPSSHQVKVEDTSAKINNDFTDHKTTLSNSQTIRSSNLYESKKILSSDEDTSNNVVEDESTKQLNKEIRSYIKSENDKLWKREDEIVERLKKLEMIYEEQIKSVNDQIKILTEQLDNLQRSELPVSSMKYWLDLFDKNQEEFNQPKYIRVSICQDRDILRDLPQGSYVYIKEDPKGIFRLLPPVSNGTYFLVPKPNFKLFSATLSDANKLFDIRNYLNDNKNFSMLCCAEVILVKEANIRIWQRHKIGILECID